MIDLDTSVCGRFESASSREWLETNGIGGYASSTVGGANTRRYHGLLIAATKPPLGRAVLLSKFEETLVIDGVRYEISCNQYPGCVYPEGYKALTGFRLDPFPIWSFEVGGIKLEKSVFMIHGENSTVCQWKIKNRSAVRQKSVAIELRPLVAFRDHHHLRRQDAGFSGEYETAEDQAAIAPVPDMPRLYFAHNGATVEPGGHWYRDFEYAVERERGFDCHEDLFQPFSLRFDLAADASVIASTRPMDIDNVAACEKSEVHRREALLQTTGAVHSFSSQLALAADQFIVSRGEGKTVIAGYPWFSDWGRDTMIALNGLTLATNRAEIAKSILSEYSKHISEGMLPNRFPDAGEMPEYNTVDATLWFFEAIRAYVFATGDYDFVRESLYEKLINVIEWHIRGTRYQIHVDTDGLLYAGEDGVQLTWMDAKIGDWVVTPRTGKAVEIQALWYNALCIMAGFASMFGDDVRRSEYSEMGEIACESFNGQFWNETSGCLYDVVEGDNKDPSIRPNQIFAVSLPYSMLDSTRARKIVKKVQAELLTPFGLRTLSPRDPRYVPVYIGSPLVRDAAYHQGTVWSWLIGPFVDAYQKVHSKDARARARVDQMIAGFKTHLSEAMVGQVSEIFDGDPPHTPRGCPAQAWSVAELLRIKASISG